MHLLDWLGRSKVNSDILTAHLPARRTVARVVAKRVAATDRPVVRAIPSIDSAQAPATGSGMEPSFAARPATPCDLRRLIFAAVASNDSERLAKIFREDPDGVVRRAVDWMKVPEALRPNPAAVRWYSEGLIAVARYCADSLDRPDLFQQLEELGLSTPGVQ